MSDGPLIDRIQQQVADRQHVDWDAVMARLRAGNAPPDEVDAFALLQLLDEVGSAHSSFQSGPDDESVSVATVPMPEAVLDDTLESWGRYLLEEKVGRGGFGSVYRARDPALDMPVAIKILHRRFSDDRLKDRLLQEGRALAQVKHPNVVRVLNVEQHGGRLGLVMEFIAGDTVDALVTAQGKLNEREATVIAEDVCRALIAVHNNGLIHRDVKARNIIRERAGRTVLMDFGAGLPLAAAPEQGRAVGTPLYMAPEILIGRPASIASDVYSVGVLLFYLVSGRYPYEGDSVDGIRAAQAEGRGLSLVGLRPELPLPFVRVVEKALAVDPADRHATPAALLEALLVQPEAPLGWKRRATAIAAGVLLLLVLTLVGGMISSAAFNVALVRMQYVRESFADWFQIGRRSLVLPIVLSLLGAWLVGLILTARRLLLGAIPVLRKADEAFRGWCGRLASRLSLTDPAVCASGLVLLTGVGIAAIWWHWSAMLVAAMSDLSTAPAETLTLLSPPFLEHRTHYRMALTLLTAANVTGWYALWRVTRATGFRMPFSVVGLETVVLVLLFGSMQLPYRILNDHNKFPSVTWHGERCFVLGERPGEELLFCPSATPRTRIRSTAEGALPRSSTGESLFATFAPAGK